MIKLTKPLCFFDLETTGIDIASARIVEIAIVKIMPSGEKVEKHLIINPTIPIPKETSEIHGITDEMVKDKPTFKQISKSLNEFLSGCDIAGYNNDYYDNQVIAEEFARLGVVFPEEGVKSIDVCSLFKKFEGRTLSDAVRYYLNKNLDDAHSALPDTMACADVFFAQIEKYEELKGKDVDFISNFTKDGRVDLGGRIVKNEKGEYIWNFGNDNKGKRIKDTLSFADWILRNNFPVHFKLQLKKILQKEGLVPPDIFNH
jgi:DNA polymerase-3 subunit epsilon